MGGIVNTLGNLVGGISGSVSDASGATSKFNAQLDPQALAQQQAFVQSLQAQMAGQGPNLAQEQLRQATSANQAMAAGMAASQKGISPALAQRQALMNQAAMQQQAAGQAGTLRAQQQLQAQGLLGQQLAQQQQQSLQAQNINAQTAAQNAAIKGRIAGGTMSGIGAGLNMLPNLFKGSTAAAGTEGGIADYAGSIGEALGSTAAEALPLMEEAGPLLLAAHGGQVPTKSAMFHHIMGTKPFMAAEGNMVPGKAEVKGDSPKNDNVPAVLSPGEIVIPRSIALHKNAPELAKKFVADTLKKNNFSQKEGYFDGQGVATDNPDSFMPQNLGSDIIKKTLQYSEGVPSRADMYNQQVQHIADITGTDLSVPENRQKIEEGVMHNLKVQQFKKQQAENQAAAEAANFAARKQQLEAEKSRLLGTPAPMSESALGVMPMQQQAAQAQPGMTQDIFGYGKTLEALKKGIGEYKTGLGMEAAATGALGKESAGALKNYQQDLIARDIEWKQSTQDITNKIRQTTNELAQAKIDPNKYLGEMSTAGKISSMLGLIMGGIGGGLSGTGGNVALDVLNKSIDRDIDAQKAAINQKNTLLSGYYKEYGNMKDAEMMTRATMQDLVSYQLKELAAKSQDPMAKARALQAAGQIDMQNAQVIGTMGAKQTMMNAAQGKNVDPSLVIRAVVDPKDQKEYYKELQTMENTVKTRDNILSAFNKLSQISTIPSKLSWQAHKQISAIKDPLTAMLSKETAGRFTEQDAKFLDSIWPAAGDDAETIKEKKMRLDSLISDKMNFPMLRPLGITPESMSRYAFGKGGEKAITLGKPVLGGK